MSFTVAYVNNLTHRIPVSPDQNYPILTPTATTGNVNHRRPYLPGVLSSIGLTQSILNSAYHGLQITADKRLSHNFQVKGYYTFGKSLDYINTQNSTQQTATDWNNIALDRGRTNNDRRHNAVISGHLGSALFRPHAEVRPRRDRRLVALDHCEFPQRRRR